MSGIPAWKWNSGSGAEAAEVNAQEKDDGAAEDDLDDGFGEGGFHVMETDIGNREQLDDDDHVGELQGEVEVFDQEGEGMEHSADHGGEAGDEPAGEGV